MYFPCVHCPATLLRGDRGNLSHALNHALARYSLDEIGAYLHRKLERGGMSELDAHRTIQAFLASSAVETGRPDA